MRCIPDVSTPLRKPFECVVSESLMSLAIWTGLSRNLDADGEAAIRSVSPFWKNLDQGAATVLVAALDPALDGK